MLKTPAIIIALLFFYLGGFSQHQNQVKILSTNLGSKMYYEYRQDTKKTKSLDSMPNDQQMVEGFVMNLFALKMISKKPEADCYFSGEVFLDPRQKYKSNPDEFEYLSEYRLNLANENIYYVPGFEKRTSFVRKGKIDEFYVAVKTGRETSQFSLDQIIRGIDVETGQEVGCDGCNFTKEIYINEDQCVLRAFFEIKPIYKGQEVIEEVNLDRILKTESSAYYFGLKTEKEKSLDEDSKVNDEESPKLVEAEKSKKKGKSIKERREIRKAKKAKANSDQKTLEVVDSNKKRNESISESTELNDDLTSIKKSGNKIRKKEKVITYHISLKVSEQENDKFDNLLSIGEIHADTNPHTGLTRYILGDYSSLEEARLTIQEVKSTGHRRASLVAYKNGKFMRYYQR